jgi:hypothetical protein
MHYRKPIAKLLGSPDLFFSFPSKLIDADHGLHTSGGVQIFSLAVTTKLEGFGGLVPYTQVRL